MKTKTQHYPSEENNGSSGFNFAKELPLLLIMLVPFIYLAYIWSSLPQQVPMHYDLQGNINRYGDKSELLILPFMMPFLTYLIFLFIPKLDPKGKIKKMGNKYHVLKLIMVFFMSALATYAIYTSQNGVEIKEALVFMMMGLMFAVLGNYFQSMKPNYFIGIRTPWTLESEVVWKETHKLGGKIWMITGLLLVVLGFVLPLELFMVFFMIGIGIMVILPIVYSYLRFKAHKSGIDKD